MSAWCDLGEYAANLGFTTSGPAVIEDEAIVREEETTHAAEMLGTTTAGTRYRDIFKHRARLQRARRTSRCRPRSCRASAGRNDSAQVSRSGQIIFPWPALFCSP